MDRNVDKKQDTRAYPFKGRLIFGLVAAVVTLTLSLWRITGAPRRGLASQQGD